MQTLQDVFTSELRDIYYAEKKIVEELARMAKKATSEELQKAFELHGEESQKHVERIETIFSSFGIASRGQRCPVIEGLIEEAKEMLEKVESDDLIDVLLVISARKVEHYEISSYGALCEIADLLGYTDAADLLEETLEEEQATEETLSDLAEDINKKALS